MRNLEISVGEHYHVYNRGVNRDSIFIDDTDRTRFLFLLLHNQSDARIFNAERNTESFQKYKSFLPYRKTISKIISKRTVELVNFAILGNHFHLTLKEISENGISKYMHRVLMSYSKYFNAKYKRTGHVFEGSFKIIHVESNEQLLHLSAYIHKNPKEIPKWHGKEFEYPWSSLGDYVATNRFHELLMPDIVLGQFSSKDDYRKFVETSKAKEVEEVVNSDNFFK
jgi:putative transposase